MGLVVPLWWQNLATSRGDLDHQGPLDGLPPRRQGRQPHKGLLPAPS